MSRPYNVLDVACFIINKHNELYKNVGITNLRLQKILYFVQSEFLIITREKCFEEKIVAWPYGPVVIEAYEEFKKYGKDNIPNINHYGKFFTRQEFNEYIIDRDDKNIILNVLQLLSQFSDFQLVEITHNQNPWLNAIRNGNNTEITKIDIEKYFMG